MEEINAKAKKIIYSQIDALAELVVQKQYDLESEIWEQYGEVGREKCVRDAKYHLSYLAEALAVSNLSLFTKYVEWVKILFAELKFPDNTMLTTLACTREALLEKLPEDVRDVSIEYLDAGLNQLSIATTELPSFLEQNFPLTDLAKDYLAALLKNDRNAANRMILQAVDKGVKVKDIYLYVFQRTLYEIGRLWQTKKISVSQEHYCSAATQLIMSQLYPNILPADKKGLRLVATCVGSELHEIGARMIADFFEMDGWDTYFLGANMPSESIVLTAMELNADILAISATMTFHLGFVRNLIEKLHSKDPRRRIKIMVGGYPFNIADGLWKQIGADGYARDAQEALVVANTLINATQR
jgi:methanogenic corrinoid protein MtbC1